MAFISLIATISCLVWVASSSVITNGTVRDSCTVTDFSQVSTAVSSCTNIVINGITVPAGQSLNLNLKDGTTVTFEGTTTFAYSEWSGPLVKVVGNGVTVKGASGSVLDGQGGLYWDGKGDSGITKPTFFYVQATGNSVFRDMKLLNCPHNCVAINQCDSVTFDDWTIDCSAGDEGVAPSGKYGHNTDGFDVYRSTNVVIQNSNVYNQDDCICVNAGSKMTFTNMYCKGSHGLSIAAGLSSSDSSLNTVTDVTFSSSTVVNSMTGLHIKTIKDAASGSISGITYKDIKFSGVTSYGIIIQQDYTNAGSTGVPGNNIPITNLVLSNVVGDVSGQYAYDVYILCGDGGCSNWQWSGVSVTGASRSNECNFTPSGFSC